MEDARVELRKFMAETFSDEEIDVFCFDYFPEVYDNFASSHTKVQKILVLLTYCTNRDQLVILAEMLRKERTNQFSQKFSTNREEVQELTSPDEDEGYFDALEKLDDHTAEAGAALNRIEKAISVIGENVQSGANDLNRITQSQQPINRNDAKRVINRVAVDLDKFANQLDAETELFSSGFIDTISKVIRIIEIGQEMPRKDKDIEDLQKAKPSFEWLVSQIITARSNVEEFRNAVATSPRMTSQYVKSKRRAVGSLNNLLNSFDIARQKTSELLEYINTLLGNEQKIFSPNSDESP